MEGGALVGHEASARPASAEELEKLHRLGDQPVVVTFKLAGGEIVKLAGRAEHADTMLGPFAPVVPT
jgi:hypothetical protein